MGLDMYLIGEIWLFRKKYEELRKKVKQLFPQLEGEASLIEFELVYWRKANAIHRWFVENVQGGKDDCGKYPVTREDLKKLLKVIEEVLENRDKAEELLPTQEGFFFGSTKYDRRYFKELKWTAEKLRKLINNEWLWENVHVFYESSW